jgi:hypothetical protein
MNFDTFLPHKWCKQPPQLANIFPLGKYQYTPQLRDQLWRHKNL